MRPRHPAPYYSLRAWLYDLALIVLLIPVALLWLLWVFTRQASAQLREARRVQRGRP